ncbi:MAG TPA: hypothetical protein VJ824_17220, partial [Bacillota bacterium]|nr:hypothetical protein [Bacillota bacterium]
MSKKNKKLLILSLCFGLAFSSIGTLSISSAEELMQKVKSLNDKYITSTPTKKDISPSEANNSAQAKAQDIELKYTNGDGVLYKGKRESLDAGDPFKNDRYHLTQQDIEELLKNGHSIEDIFKADEIGNHINEDPKNLLAKKKEKGTKWEDMEETVTNERAEKFLGQLKEKHPKEFQQLQNQGLKQDEQFVLLSMYDRHLASGMQELIDTYKKDGNEGINRILQNPKQHSNVSKEKIDALGLTADDADGLSEDEIDRIKNLSEKTNIPLKELLNGYK